MSENSTSDATETVASEYRHVVATMEVGGYYGFNFPASPSGSGIFEGWTDFGWMIFTDKDGETRFYNPARLSTIRPETFDSPWHP